MVAIGADRLTSDTRRWPLPFAFVIARRKANLYRALYNMIAPANTRSSLCWTRARAPLAPVTVTTACQHY